MRKAVSFVLGAVLLVGGATIGSRSSSAFANEQKRNYSRADNNRRPHRHYRHRTRGRKGVPNAESLRKQSW
jgi:hypothetical protein